ncbi:MAG: glycogen/starch synthase [Chlamydiae bacterium]|nr:glycogen/starch synthase [Chlamydiota bacterium]
MSIKLNTSIQMIGGPSQHNDLLPIIRQVENSQKNTIFIIFFRSINYIVSFFNKNLRFFEKEIINHDVSTLICKNIQLIQKNKGISLGTFESLPGIASKNLDNIHRKALFAISVFQYEYVQSQLQAFIAILEAKGPSNTITDHFQALPLKIQDLLKNAYAFETKSCLSSENFQCLLDGSKDRSSLLERTIQVLGEQKLAYLQLLQNEDSKTIDKIQKTDKILTKPLEELDIFDGSDLVDGEQQLAKPINVTMLSVEYTPFVKQGGLAEAVEGLSLGIKKQHPDNKVRLIFLFFSTIPSSVIKACTPPIELISSAGEPYKAYIYDYQGIECVLIEHPSFQLGDTDPNIYGPDFPTQAIRFAEFTKLAADYIDSHEKPDVLHFHDWHAAGVLHALKARNPDKTIPSVFTFHNNSRASQGRLETGCYSYDPVVKGFQDAGIIGLNHNFFLKTLLEADMITTVSKQFVRESQTSEYGEGGSFAVRHAARQGKITGILNGSNPDRWNPANNSVLKKWRSLKSGDEIDLTYSVESDSILAKKRESKEELQAFVKKYLPKADIDFSKPIVTYIGRFDSFQKGLDHFDTAIEEVLKNGGQFICMGTSEDSKATEILDELQVKYPKGVLFLRDYKTANGNLYYQQGDGERPGIGPVVRAATDMIFMPSNFEPCGLVQFEGWLYGSLALGAKTGGLADSILPLEQGEDRFNGFLFEQKKTEEPMRESIRQSLQFFRETDDPTKEKICRRVMTEALASSWNSSPHGLSPSEQYALVYRAAIARHAEKDLSSHRNYYSLLSRRITPINPTKAAVDAEGKYLDAFYSKSLSAEEYVELYHSMPEGVRKSTPAPYGKDVSINLHNELGAIQRGPHTQFRVYAPNAKNVEVILYDDKENEVSTVSLSKNNKNIWDVTVPTLPEGQRYRYRINGILKIDPFAKHHIKCKKRDLVPYSVIKNNSHDWQDTEWMQVRKQQAGESRPMSIFEVHPLSWKRINQRPLNYRELADELIKHAQDYGFTHVELMGILEHPMKSSLGYQVTGYYAPTSRMGSVEDFAYLVDKLHKNKIGVILDWVPAHFASDEFGLKDFDGTKLFEPSSLGSKFSVRNLAFKYGGLHFDYSKKFVRDFLLSNAMFWIKDLHIDGLRVDCVRSILNSEDTKNSHLFLSQLNHAVQTHGEGAITIAEDFSGMKEISKPFHEKGFQFDMKWHVGWVKDWLNYFSLSLKAKQGNYELLKHAIQSDNFHKQILPISHDEACATNGHTLGALSDTIDSEFQRRANHRAMVSSIFCSPGKKLLFMGEESENQTPWGVDHLKKKSPGLQDVQPIDPIRDLQGKALFKRMHEIYTTEAAFYQHDANGHDLEWVEDPSKKIHAYRRSAKDGTTFCCFHNFASSTPERLTVKIPKDRMKQLDLREIFSTDDTAFGGHGFINSQITIDKDDTYTITIPPFSTVIIKEGVFAEQLKKTDLPTTAEKVSSFFKKILTVIAFPLRYFGSKNWSIPGAACRLLQQSARVILRLQKAIKWKDVFPTGNVSKAEKRLSQEEARAYVNPLAIIAYTHNGDTSWIEPLGIRPAQLSDKECEEIGIQKDGTRYVDTKTKVSFSITEQGDNLYLSITGAKSQHWSSLFNGTADPKESKETFATVGAILGSSSEFCEDLDKLFLRLKQNPKWNRKKWTLLGQSRGGGYAQYIALKNKQQAICFNSVPMGAGLQAEIPPEILNNADRYCTHLCVEGDLYNDNPYLSPFDRALSTLGIKTPGSFGHCYSIPSAYKSSGDTHSYVLGSLFSYLGYDKRCKMSEYVASQSG